jgi:hypothetical protein
MGGRKMKAKTRYTSSGVGAHLVCERCSDRVQKVNHDAHGWTLMRTAQTTEKG